MFAEFLRSSAFSTWPLAALLIFLSVFAGILLHLWTGRRSDASISRMASLPLEDDIPSRAGEERTEGRGARS